MIYLPKNSLNRLFLALVSLLAFFLILDFEFAIGGISGSGERVGYSSALVGDVLVRNASQVVSIKVSDLLILAICICLSVAVAFQPRLLAVKKATFLQYALLACFVVVGFVALLWNSTLYTSAQFLVCLVYLAKFAEISLIFVFVCAFFRLGGNARTLFGSMLAAGLIAAVLGTVNAFTQVFTGWLISDRVQFFGILVLLVPVWWSAHLSGWRLYESHGSSLPWFLIGTILLGISILLCGKRTVILGLVVSFGYVAWSHLNKRSIAKITVTILTLSIIAIPFVVEQIERSFGRSSEYIWQGLESVYSSRIAESWIGAIPISGLDYSITERLGRWLVATDHFVEKPFIGVGFFGTPYVYGFIPDSAPFQLLVETGLLGSFAMFMFFMGAWRRSKQSLHPLWGGDGGVGFRGAMIGFIVMSLTANTVYVFNLFGMFLTLAAINHALHGSARRSNVSIDRVAHGGRSSAARLSIQTFPAVRQIIDIDPR